MKNRNGNRKARVICSEVRRAGFYPQDESPRIPFYFRNPEQLFAP